MLQEVSAFVALLQRICNWFRSGVRKPKKTLQGFSYISLTVVKEAMDLVSISCHGYLFFLKPQVLQPSNYLRNLVLALKEIIIAAVDKGTEILILTGKTRKLKNRNNNNKTTGADTRMWRGEDDGPMGHILGGMSPHQIIWWGATSVSIHATRAHTRPSCVTRKGNAVPSARPSSYTEEGLFLLLSSGASPRRAPAPAEPGCHVGLWTWELWALRAGSRRQGRAA